MLPAATAFSNTILAILAAFSNTIWAVSTAFSNTLLGQMIAFSNIGRLGSMGLRGSEAEFFAGEWGLARRRGEALPLPANGFAAPCAEKRRGEHA